MSFFCGYQRGNQVSFVDWLALRDEHRHAEHEARAWRAFLDAMDAGDDELARQKWQAFVTLHRQRPASMVARMERERGLR